jgi:putative restriction endonuclease
MKFFLGVTDINWFDYLSRIHPEDVNFWQPGGGTTFRAVSRGAPFLFKLKKPRNVIGGLGFFSAHTSLPVSIAWDAFGNRNGCDTLSELRAMIAGLRRDKTTFNPVIGCIVLTNPVFFDPADWIETPPDWAPSIVRGKTYEMDGPVGSLVWQKVQRLLDQKRYLPFNAGDGDKNQLQLENSMEEPYGRSVLTRVRVGQGAFRALVTDAYARRCSITGEKTLPVLEAAHIKPFAASGPQSISNGLLLRSDIHKLFDSGYLTVTGDLKVEVSRRIREEFENGREYYQYHGKNLIFVPGREMDLPAAAYIDWHNNNIYKG